jgi:Domain of unknown function (DUF397)
VADAPSGQIIVRDSKDKAGSFLYFTSQAWQSFVDAIKDAK